MTSGKAKGSEYERTICKQLSKWISEGARDDCYWRSQSSGARFTQRKKKGTDTEGQCGDITSTSDIGKILIEKCNIECKFYKDLQIWSLILSNSKGGMISFWDQTVRDAESSSRLPIMLCKQNFKPTLFCTDDKLSGFLNSWFSLRPRVTVLNSVRTMKIYIFEDDILTLDPKMFQQMLSEEK